jgi:hypothetical protein
VEIWIKLNGKNNMEKNDKKMQKEKT